MFNRYLKHEACSTNGILKNHYMDSDNWIDYILWCLIYEFQLNESARSPKLFSIWRRIFSSDNDWNPISPTYTKADMPSADESLLKTTSNIAIIRNYCQTVNVVWHTQARWCQYCQETVITLVMIWADESFNKYCRIILSIQLHHSPDLRKPMTVKLKSHFLVKEYDRFETSVKPSQRGEIVYGTVWIHCLASVTINLKNRRVSIHRGVERCGYFQWKGLNLGDLK